MSYDLFFFKKADNTISDSELKNYLNKIPNVKANDLGTVWEYHNKETESYCVFEMSEVESNSDEMKSENFPDFQYVGLSFNINYVRPIVFGEECFPLVDQLVRELNLFISNPQSEAEVPQVYTEGALEKEWTEFNKNMARFTKPNMSIFERYLYGIY